LVHVVPLLTLLHTSTTAGTLPSAWGNGTTRFYSLDFSNNQIGGGLPAEWWRLVADATKVDLHNNQLKGSIPAAWSDAGTPTSAPAQLQAVDLRWV
jgi:hypothetical protein